MQKTTIKQIAIALALFILGYLSFGGKLHAQGLEKTKVSIAVGGKSLFYYLPLTIAEQLGYFKEEGLQVEISDFAGGAKALQAMLGGSADVVSGSYEHTINLQGKGQYITAFVVQGRAPQNVFVVSNKTLANFKSVADLKGKKIGVSAPGSSTNMMANFVLSKGGLKPGDVSFIGVGTSAGAISALRAGQIDAMVNLDPVITMLEQNNDIRIIADTRTLKDTVSVYGGLMPAATLYAPEEFIRKNPKTAQALSNAIVHALKWLKKATPEEVANVVPENYLLGDRALYLEAFIHGREALSQDGVMVTDGPQTTLKALQSFEPQLAGKNIDLNRTYTNTFAQLSDQKFK